MELQVVEWLERTTSDRKWDSLFGLLRWVWMFVVYMWDVSTVEMKESLSADWKDVKMTEKTDAK